MFTDCAPSPAGAVNEKVQLVFAVDDWRWPVNAPETSTHFVSLDVVMFSVSAPPCFAKSVVPTLTVPAPPLNEALDTVEP